MASSYWSRLKPEMDAHGFTIPQLAEHLQVSFQAVAKVRDGGAFGSTNNIKAAKLFGLSPEWLATGRGNRLARESAPSSDTQMAPQPQHNPMDSGQAHAVSLRAFTLPPSLSWEQVMQSQELPDRFVVESPDDALAPNLPRGVAIMFERATVPQPGDCVLVEDSRGARYMRRYVQGIGGAFAAQAINDAYVSLDSVRDGLRVLAVMAWRAERRV